MHWDGVFSVFRLWIWHGVVWSLSGMYVELKSGSQRGHKIPWRWNECLCGKRGVWNWVGVLQALNGIGMEWKVVMSI